MKDLWTSQLTGLTVHAVERWEGCACVIKFTGGYSVHIESLWRLIASAALVLTSRDEGQLFGRNEPIHSVSMLSSKLLGDTLISIQVSHGTADLTLHFKDQALQVVSDSSGYEAWQVEGPTGIVAVGQGGGNVAVWN